MPSYNEFDEAIFDIPRERLYRAMILEFGGNRQWWHHLWEATPRGNRPITEPGGCIDIVVHGPLDAHFAARTAHIVAMERLDIEFFEGDFVGTASWRWQTMDGGQTRVSQHWLAAANSAKLKLLALIVNIGKIHSKVIQGGFQGLADHLGVEYASSAGRFIAKRTNDR